MSTSACIHICMYSYMWTNTLREPYLCACSREGVGVALHFGKFDISLSKICRINLGKSITLAVHCNRLLEMYTS